jgi:hypothetical protein
MVPDLQVLDAGTKGQHPPDTFIAGDARERRSDRESSLDEREVVHVDWRMLNADQHLAGSRGRRFLNLDMLEDIRRLPESFYPHCAHSLPPLLRETAEHDQIQTGEWASGLLHAATNHQTAELDRYEAKALDQLLDDGIGLGVVPEPKITRRPPYFTDPSLKRAVTIELKALTMRAPGARAATTSLAPFPPRSARTSFPLVSTKGFVASMSTRPFQADRPFNADSTFRQGTASNTYSRLAASSTEAADAPRPSSATWSASASGPRRLLKTTSWPLASASRAKASATVPAPIVPNFMFLVSSLSKNR